ncbi:MAG: hypothetical protein EOP48_32185 [Sphingobacteriales bacterium]|nr:MAG: hypothetical protein EOP48_32185 [Sphingobacteriales bacterium]
MKVFNAINYFFLFRCSAEKGIEEVGNNEFLDVLTMGFVLNGARYKNTDLSAKASCILVRNYFDVATNDSENAN